MFCERCVINDEPIPAAAHFWVETVNASVASCYGHLALETDAMLSDRDNDRVTVSRLAG